MLGRAGQIETIIGWSGERLSRRRVAGKPSRVVHRHVRLR